MVIRNKKQYEKAVAELEELRAAWKKILNAQSYNIGDRQLTRASLTEIKTEIDEYESAIDAYESGSSMRRSRRAVPV